MNALREAADAAYLTVSILFYRTNFARDTVHVYLREHVLDAFNPVIPSVCLNQGGPPCLILS